TIHGGTITGNTAGGKGGGIYNAYRSGNPAVLNLSGSTVISGNGNGNLYLEEGTVINVDGAFSSGASIGVTMAGGRGVFTSGYSTCNGSADPSAVFSADGGNYMVAFSGSEAAMSLYYHYVSQKSYSNLQVLLNETGLLGAVSPMVVQMMMAVYFPDNGVPVSAISYTYRSTDPQGDPVELSALLYVPNAALSGTKLTGITLACHGTIAKKTQCPTMTAQFEGVIAWKNHAVVMPDYYGFGASADRPQGYLDAENTAHNSIDAYLAAVQLLEDRGVTIPQKLYSFGYSQGGFNSMANLRYVAQHPELGISFDKVFCGGSPFDVMGTWNEYTNGSFNNSLAFVPMTLVSINETHKLGLSYSDLFKGALLNNWQNWILSKNYTTTEISNLLISNGQSTISGILTDDMVAGTGAAFNSIRSVCESYSLISGWTPPSGRKYIFIYHSKDDDTVPYANLTAMKSFLDRTAPGSYTLYDGNDGGHTSAAVSFVQNIIKEW
ncbi:MAG: hypothetical protein IKX45_02120, partial [Bacteroidales bacterium]|nr:hypothetical protein [Bacteroidales bacterium]